MEITDPLKYFERLGNERGAQSRLDDILDGETRNAVAGNDLVELIRSTNREASQDGLIADIQQDSLQKISVGRGAIQDQIVNLPTKELKILELRFSISDSKELIMPKKFDNVYERMISERNQCR